MKEEKLEDICEHLIEKKIIIPSIKIDSCSYEKRCRFQEYLGPHIICGRYYTQDTQPVKGQKKA